MLLLPAAHLVRVQGGGTGSGCPAVHSLVQLEAHCDARLFVDSTIHTADVAGVQLCAQVKGLQRPAGRRRAT